MRLFCVLVVLSLFVSTSSSGQFKRINAANGFPPPNSLTGFGNKVFFVFNDGLHGSELWSSDGTDEGTSMVKDIIPSDFTSPVQALTVRNNLLFFDARGTVWRTDGTEAGTLRIDTANANTWAIAPVPTSPVINNEVYYFQAVDELWKTDGSEKSATFVKKLPYSASDSEFIVVDNNFYFVDSNHTLWRSDGTADGTVSVFNFSTSFPADGQYILPKFYAANGRWFMYGQSSTAYTLWVTDGTLNGTSMFAKYEKDPKTGGPLILGAMGNNVYFENGSLTGGELFKSDGTTAGTSVLKNISPNQTVLGRPYMIYNDESSLYIASPTNDGIRIWKTDGTGSGTVTLSKPQSVTSPAAKTNGKIYFAAGIGIAGIELWMTDGTTGGTKMVGEIIKGQTSSIYDYQSLAATDNSVFFIARDAGNGYGLWTLDPNWIDTRVDQQINFAPITTDKFSDVPFTVTATASSGLPVSLELISGPADLTENNKLWITGVGVVTLAAAQAGNDQFNPAYAEQSFNVEVFTGIKDENNVVMISPNPATSTLLIQAPPAFRSFSIKDMLGRDAISMPITNETTTIDVGQLSRGMYIVKLVGADQNIVTRKIILR